MHLIDAQEVPSGLPALLHEGCHRRPSEKGLAQEVGISPTERFLRAGGNLQVPTGCHPDAPASDEIRNYLVIDHH